jgi:hypothetical protein
MACQICSLFLALSEEFYVMDAIGRKTLRLPKPMHIFAPGQHAALAMRGQRAKARDNGSNLYPLQYLP